MEEKKGGSSAEEGEKELGEEEGDEEIKEEGRAGERTGMGAVTT